MSDINVHHFLSKIFITENCSEVYSKPSRYFTWKWGNVANQLNLKISPCQTIAYFHPEFSCGTSAITSSTALNPGSQHYWEIQYQYPVYGTDIMIGVGTENFDPRKYENKFRSLIGDDDESWGLSYHGYIYHGGVKHFLVKRRWNSLFNGIFFHDGPRFISERSVVGMHLDSWHGKLSLCLDGKPYGVIAHHPKLRTDRLFVIASSTAARTSLRLCCSISTPTSLEFISALNIMNNNYEMIDNEVFQNNNLFDDGCNRVPSQLMVNEEIVQHEDPLVEHVCKKYRHFLRPYIGY